MSGLWTAHIGQSINNCFKRIKERYGGIEGRRKGEREKDWGKRVPHSIPFTTIRTKISESEYQGSHLKLKLQNISKQLHWELFRIIRNKLYI